LHEANAPLSARMTQAKIADALESGAEVLCTACPHCQLRFESVLASAPAPAIRTLLYPQLLGLALGLPAESLGL
jgi:heterodisulfide reductase subunit B